MLLAAKKGVYLNYPHYVGKINGGLMTNSTYIKANEREQERDTDSTYRRQRKDDAKKNANFTN